MQQLLHFSTAILPSQDTLEKREERRGREVVRREGVSEGVRECWEWE